ncbi:MAG: NAD(P)/FAD-dependent oxidoreductase, partial [Kordiimonas sp.]
METVETLIVGAGVVGLAIAQSLASSGREVVVVEKNNMAGQGISARNSGVIHAGLYYPNNSLKARFCVEGAELLYRYCNQFGVSNKRIGKYIVAATDAERHALVQLQENAKANGVVGLRSFTGVEMSNIDPELKVKAALFSPNSGIVEVSELILSLIGQMERCGGVIAYGTEVLGLRQQQGKLEVLAKDDASYSLIAKNVINCSGLGAQRLAEATTGYKSANIPKLRMV